MGVTSTHGSNPVLPRGVTLPGGFDGEGEGEEPVDVLAGAWSVEAGLPALRESFLGLEVALAAETADVEAREPHLKAVSEYRLWCYAVIDYLSILKPSLWSKSLSSTHSLSTLLLTHFIIGIEPVEGDLIVQGDRTTKAHTRLTKTTAPWCVSTSKFISRVQKLRKYGNHHACCQSGQCRKPWCITHFSFLSDATSTFKYNG